MEYLAKAKQKKIINFIDSVAQSKNVRQQVLFSFAEFFNFESSTFFLVDQEGNPVDPIALNIDRESISVYCNYYAKIDIFHPHNLSQNIINKKILYITDIMPLKKYEKTEYYNDFLKKQGFYHEISITLFTKEGMLGGIGLLKPKKEKFDYETKENLRIVYNFISGLLSQSIALQRTAYNEQIYKQCTNESTTGIILFNEDLSIIFANNAAYEIVKNISIKNPALEKLVKHVVSLSGTTFYSGVSTLNLQSPFLDEFTIRITPLNNYSTFNQKTYLLSITPEHTRSNKSNDRDIQNIFGLTNRELDVVSLMLKGSTNEEIAKELFISYSTVKAHLRNIYQKTDTYSRTKLCYKIQNIKQLGSL